MTGRRVWWCTGVAVFVAAVGAHNAPGQHAAAPSPYIGFEYDWKSNFGVLIVKDPFGRPVKKQLTFDTSGQTNGMLVRIDGKDTEYGTTDGQFIERGDESHNPSTCVWDLGKIEFTHTLEIQPGKTNKLDTLAVRCVVKNKDDRPHSVGIRVMIDSAIGTPDNDGVPFRYAGGSELITTFKDFPEGTVPEWVEALEKPNQKDPGTIAIMTLKVGRGMQPPARASITRWPGASPSVWEIPLYPIAGEGARGDSSLVLYWMPKELKPNQTRVIGYSYGTQDKPSDALSAPPPGGNARSPVAAKRPALPRAIAISGGPDSQVDAQRGGGNSKAPKSNDKAGRPDADNNSLEKLARQAAQAAADHAPSACCQGDLSAQHAQCALKVALGLARRESQSDADGDGKVTEKDARLLLHKSVALARTRE